jgi:hypothetical protein
MATMYENLCGNSVRGTVDICMTCHKRAFNIFIARL